MGRSSDQQRHRRILPTLWVLVKKFYPDGTFKKYKARLVVRGDLMEGTKQESYSPVAAWSSIRFLLVLTLMMDWVACTKDLLSAFLHAKLDEPIWIHLPRGYRSTRRGKTCLRLKKSLYGTRFAPKLFYLCILEALIKLGFVQSKMDPCFLMKKDIMLVIYVDDLLISAKSQALIDELLQALKDASFELEDGSTLTEYLGINIERTNGQIHLRQIGLIDKVLKYTNMDESRPNHTPATVLPLGADPEGEPFAETWKYNVVCGMLLYLSTNTRYDITYAVSQICRYTNAPKKSHGTAVKMILRYLKGTRTMGTILRPTGRFDLDCMCDADFAGRWNCEPLALPSSAKSRTGFIIYFSGCPVVSYSRLQTRIATSTLMAEYYAISTAMRTMIPLRTLILELVATLGLSATPQTFFHSRVYNDNNGAINLATEQRLSNRTRFFSVDVHFFWDAVNNLEIAVLRCDSTDNDGDGNTKGLARHPYVQWRVRVVGW